MWEKGDPSALLLGIQTGAPTCGKTVWSFFKKMINGRLIREVGDLRFSDLLLSLYTIIGKKNSNTVKNVTIVTSKIIAQHITNIQGLWI